MIATHKGSSSNTLARAGLTNTEAFEPNRVGNAMKWGVRFSKTKVSEKNVEQDQIVVVLYSQALFLLC